MFSRCENMGRDEILSTSFYVLCVSLGLFGLFIYVVWGEKVHI